MRKTKVITSGRDLYTLQASGKYPCPVCRKGVGKISIFFSGCLFWVHNEDVDFRCKSCLANAWAIDGRPCVELAHDKLDVVDNFVYHGDCICPGGGYELATINRRYCMKKIQRTVTLAYL